MSDLIRTDGYGCFGHKLETFMLRIYFNVFNEVFSAFVCWYRGFPGLTNICTTQQKLAKTSKTR